jgi:hypothetical protein
MTLLLGTSLVPTNAATVSKIGQGGADLPLHPQRPSQLDTSTTARLMSSPPSRTPARLRYSPAVSLLTDLDAFFTERQRCGDLDAGVESAVVWIACECGARMARCVDVGDVLAFDD